MRRDLLLLDQPVQHGGRSIAAASGVRRRLGSRRRIHISNAGAATDVCDPEHQWRVHPAATRPAADVHGPAINRGASFNRQAPADASNSLASAQDLAVVPFALRALVKGSWLGSSVSLRAKPHPWRRATARRFFSLTGQKRVFRRGTKGSNPSPSSGESGANSTPRFGDQRPVSLERRGPHIVEVLGAFVFFQCRTMYS